jgi:indole-3-glycerol phosphate synthase
MIAKKIIRPNGNLDGRVLIVAELKMLSPFGYKNPRTLEDTLAQCEKVGDIISVHTNPLWGGSFEHLEDICKRANKPVLAKGFHDTTVDVRRAIECGATYVLTVGWWPDDTRCWHECTTFDELKETDAPAAVFNSRDPHTGKTLFDGNLVHVASSARTSRGSRWLCQASGIKHANDVGNVEAVLIGQNIFDVV